MPEMRSSEAMYRRRGSDTRSTGSSELDQGTRDWRTQSKMDTKESKTLEGSGLFHQSPGDQQGRRWSQTDDWQAGLAGQAGSRHWKRPAAQAGSPRQVQSRAGQAARQA
eukprot:2996144-Heterocapsa_arctica.AAC.1